MTYLKLIGKKRYIVDWVDKGCPQQPTTGQPTTNRAQSNLFKLPRCEGGNRKVTFRASIHTAYRDRKIKENPNGFLERIETIPTDKEHLSRDEVIRLARKEFKLAAHSAYVTAVKRKILDTICFHMSAKRTHKN